MTIKSAVETIYSIINCDFIDMDFEDKLREICRRLENNEWGKEPEND